MLQQTLLCGERKKNITHWYVRFCKSFENNIDTVVLVAFRNVHETSFVKFFLAHRISEVAPVPVRVYFYRGKLEKFLRGISIRFAWRFFSNRFSPILTDLRLRNSDEKSRIFARKYKKITLCNYTTNSVRLLQISYCQIWNAEERITPWLLLHFQMIITTGLREIQYYSVVTRSQWLVYSMTKTETNCRKFTIGSFPSREKTQRNPIRRWWIVKTTPSFL